MRPRDRLVRILGIIGKHYEKWDPPVNLLMKEHKKDPFRILVATVLSARTKDGVTAQAVNRLFSYVSCPEELRKLSAAAIGKFIYPVGFYKTKAKALKNLAAALVCRYSSRVPETREELMLLDGVGRKTANLVLSRAFGIPAICVDVHVHRIMNRTGVIKTVKEIDTELELEKIAQEKHWAQINTLIVALGQTICKSRNPDCRSCPVSHLCLKIMD